MLFFFARHGFSVFPMLPIQESTLIEGCAPTYIYDEEMTVIPRMRQTNKRFMDTRLLKESVLINMDKLQKVFHQSLKTAALNLGICATVLKRYCA